MRDGGGVWISRESSIYWIQQLKASWSQLFLCNKTLFFFSKSNITLKTFYDVKITLIISCLLCTKITGQISSFAKSKKLRVHKNCLKKCFEKLKNFIKIRAQGEKRQLKNLPVIFRENSNSKRYMHTNVHSSTIYNSQDMEET